MQFCFCVCVCLVFFNFILVFWGGVESWLVVLIPSASLYSVKTAGSNPVSVEPTTQLGASFPSWDVTYHSGICAETQINVQIHMCNVVC